MLPDDKAEPAQMPGDSRLRPLAHIFDAYKRRYHHATDTRVEDSTQRMEAHYYWNGFRQDLRDLQESAGYLSAWPAGNKSGPFTKRPKYQFRKLHNKMQSDLETLASKHEAVDELMRALRAHDRRVERADQALDNASQALFSALQQKDVALGGLYDNDKLSDVSLASTSAFGSEASVTVGTPMPPQLVEFYNAVSNYKIMRERLVDLEIERQEQWERRLLLADQDQTLDGPDEQFKANWQKDFVAPEQDFENVRMMLRQAHKLCMEAGIATPNLESLQVSKAEGDQDQHSSSQVNSAQTLLNQQSTDRADLSSMILDKSLSQHDLSRENLLTEQETSPLDFGAVQAPGSSSPSSPPNVNGWMTERVKQWVDRIELGAVD